jgi:hypothetical protein
MNFNLIIRGGFDMALAACRARLEVEPIRLVRLESIDQTSVTLGVPYDEVDDVVVLLREWKRDDGPGPGHLVSWTNGVARD